jgi:hypothetical protein
MLIGPSAHAPAEEARVDYRAWPPRIDDTAVAVPSSSRDAGNRISFNVLRGFTETRDSAFATESRVQSVSLDAVSASRVRVPQVGHAR